MVVVALLIYNDFVYLPLFLPLDSPRHLVFLVMLNPSSIISLRTLAIHQVNTGQHGKGMFQCNSMALNLGCMLESPRKSLRSTDAGVPPQSF